MYSSAGINYSCQLVKNYSPAETGANSNTTSFFSGNTSGTDNITQSMVVTVTTLNEQLPGTTEKTTLNMTQLDTTAATSTQLTNSNVTNNDTSVNSSANAKDSLQNVTSAYTEGVTRMQSATQVVPQSKTTNLNSTETPPAIVTSAFSGLNSENYSTTSYPNMTEDITSGNISMSSNLTGNITQEPLVLWNCTIQDFSSVSTNSSVALSNDSAEVTLAPSVTFDPTAVASTDVGYVASPTLTVDPLPASDVISDVSYDAAASDVNYDVSSVLPSSAFGENSSAFVEYSVPMSVSFRPEPSASEVLDLEPTSSLLDLEPTTSGSAASALPPLNGSLVVESVYRDVVDDSVLVSDVTHSVTTPDMLADDVTENMSDRDSLYDNMSTSNFTEANTLTVAMGNVTSAPPVSTVSPLAASTLLSWEPTVSDNRELSNTTGEAIDPSSAVEFNTTLMTSETNGTGRASFKTTSSEEVILSGNVIETSYSMTSATSAPTASVGVDDNNVSSSTGLSQSELSFLPTLASFTEGLVDAYWSPTPPLETTEAAMLSESNLPVTTMPPSVAPENLTTMTSSQKDDLVLTEEPAFDGGNTTQVLKDVLNVTSTFDTRSALSHMQDSSDIWNNTESIQSTPVSVSDNRTGYPTTDDLHTEDFVLAMSSLPLANTSLPSTSSTLLANTADAEPSATSKYSDTETPVPMATVTIDFELSTQNYSTDSQSDFVAAGSLTPSDVVLMPSSVDVVESTPTLVFAGSISPTSLESSDVITEANMNSSVPSAVGSTPGLQTGSFSTVPGEPSRSSPVATPDSSMSVSVTYLSEPTRPSIASDLVPSTSLPSLPSNSVSPLVDMGGTSRLIPEETVSPSSSRSSSIVPEPSSLSVFSSTNAPMTTPIITTTTTTTTVTLSTTDTTTTATTSTSTTSDDDDATPAETTTASTSGAVPATSSTPSVLTTQAPLTSTSGGLTSSGVGVVSEMSTGVQPITMTTKAPTVTPPVTTSSAPTTTTTAATTTKGYKTTTQTSQSSSSSAIPATTSSLSSTNPLTSGTTASGAGVTTSGSGSVGGPSTTQTTPVVNTPETEGERTPESTSTMSSSTQPTSSTSTEVITTETPLNTSDALKEFWVMTVIEEKVTVNVTLPAWRADLERRLADLYDEGFLRLAGGASRKRRATTVGDTTLQMIDVSRDRAGARNVTLIYYMERFGNITPAAAAVDAMNTFDVQSIALRLKRVVVVRAKVYAPPYVPPPHDPRLWLVGAVIGGIIGGILFIWCVLFIYCKCTRPPKARQRTPRTPRSTRISMTGAEYDTNSYRSKMPKIQNGVQKGKSHDPSSASPQTRLVSTKEVGFDIARTEVGLENEIQRDLKRKPPEPYRKRPDGSTELEGMYSAGETPPPGHRPSSTTSTATPPTGSAKAREAAEGEEGGRPLSRSKSRSQIPIDASLRRSLPPGPGSLETIHPPKKNSRKKRQESEESESDDDRSEDRKPLSPERQEKKKSKKKGHKQEKARAKSRKKRRDSDGDQPELDSSQAGLYENVAKMARTDHQRPEKLRTTQHAIKLPPLITQPLVGDVLSRSLREETELQESLQQKADIERWRNKQRQRERTKGSKGSRTHAEGDRKEKRRAYRRAQKEIGDVLGDPEGNLPGVFQQKPKKKKKSSRRPVRQVSSSSEPAHQVELEMRDMVGPTDAQYSHLNGLEKQESTIVEESDSSSETEESSDGSYLDNALEPTLEEARQRMHALVDNAFAMISPYRRRNNRITPSSVLPLSGPAPPPAHGKASARARRRCLTTGSNPLPPTGSHSHGQVVWDPEQEEDAPRHTPLYITPMTKIVSPGGHVIWSPYRAADEAAQIDDNQSLPGGIKTTPDVRRRLSEGSEASAAGSNRSSDAPSRRTGRPVSAYNYRNPAYVKDADTTAAPTGDQELSQSRGRLLPKESTGGATDAPATSSLAGDQYTSVVMDTDAFGHRVARSNSPPQRDLDVTGTSQLQQPVTNGGSTLSSLSDYSFQTVDNKGQSGSLLPTLPEQTSLQMPCTEVKVNMEPQKDDTKDPLRIDPEIPKISQNTDEDEIDIIQRGVNSGEKLTPWEKSLRKELERLANRSSADTTITTTALV